MSLKPCSHPECLEHIKVKGRRLALRCFVTGQTAKLTEAKDFVCLQTPEMVASCQARLAERAWQTHPEARASFKSYPADPAGTGSDLIKTFEDTRWASE